MRLLLARAERITLAVTIADSCAHPTPSSPFLLPMLPRAASASMGLLPIQRTTAQMRALSRGPANFAQVGCPRPTPRERSLSSVSKNDAMVQRYDLPDSQHGTTRSTHSSVTLDVVRSAIASFPLGS